MQHMSQYKDFFVVLIENINKKLELLEIMLGISQTVLTFEISFLFYQVL